MNFLHLGREVGIGANSYLLEVGGKRILLDAGMHPKHDGPQAVPRFALLGDGGAAPDAALLTHAHQDHVGALPVFTRLFPQCPVFMTPETTRIADIMLHNSVNVMQRQQEEKGKADAVLFTHRGVELSRRAWRGVPCGSKFSIEGERSSTSGDEVAFSFHPAGHILGSAGVRIEARGQTLFYTGDVHFEGQTLLRPAEFPESGVDILVMETTRGDTPTSPDYTREKEKEKLADIIQEAFEEGAAVTIPVFALGKTQELLAMLWELRRAKKIPISPIYIGGLSTKIAEVYDVCREMPERLHPELELLHDLAPYVTSGNDIESLRPRKRCIFALSSGMLTENTLSNLFVRRILEDPKQRLVFVGYCDPESPAGKLRAALSGDSVVLDERLPALRKKCQVHELNFSAHANREALRDYAIRLRPKTILLVHGDPPAMEWFRKELSNALPDTRIAIPQPGIPIEL